MKDLNHYFEVYSAAYLIFDPDALLPFFHQPSIIHNLPGVHLIESDQDIRDYERPMLERLRQMKSRTLAPA